MKTILIIFAIILVKVTLAQTPQWELLGLENEAINDIVVDDGNNVYVGCTSGVFKSTDNGSTWISKNNGLEDILGVQKLFVDYTGNILLAGIGMFHDGLYGSTDGAESWARIVDTLGVSINQFDDITVIPNESGGYIYTSNNYDGIFRSTDNGITWQYTSYTNPGATSIGINTNGYMFFANYTASWFGIYRSADLGLNWIRQAFLGATALVYLRNSSILAGCYDQGIGSFDIYKSTDDGITWIKTNTFSGLSSFTDFALDINDDIYVSLPGEVYLSTNNGDSWIDYGLTGPATLCLAIDSSGYVWAGTNFDGIYRTEGRTVPVELLTFTAEVIENNVNLNWSTATEINNQGFEILRTAQNDINDWEKIGFVAGNGTTTEIRTYSFVDQNIAPGSYKYRLKQIDFDGSFEYSDIIEAILAEPDKFELYQNYPNPFNPSTAIRYSVATNELVTLSVLDVLGCEVAELVNKEMKSGTYTENFDGSKLPSGIYFYSISAGDFHQTKKMILMK